MSLGKAMPPMPFLTISPVPFKMPLNFPVHFVSLIQYPGSPWTVSVTPCRVFVETGVVSLTSKKPRHRDAFVSDEAPSITASLAHTTLMGQPPRRMRL